MDGCLSKAIHYRHFYSSFDVQFYVRCMLPIHLTRILAILRYSAHTLRVEKGRHNDTPYQQGLCIFCTNNQIEDEFHLVLQCPFYSDLRLRYIPKRYIKQHPSVQDFYLLMQCKNESIITRLAQYLIVAFQKRNDSLTQKISFVGIHHYTETCHIISTCIICLYLYVYFMALLNILLNVLYYGPVA